MIAAEGKNEDWQTHFGCIKIIVDSKTLYDIVAGEAVYSGTNVRDEFINIDNILRQWMTTDRTTASPVGNPVEWRPRELNHGADSQCNKTLDNNSKHCFEAKDVSKYIHRTFNLFVQTDGGCRGDGRSASGWRIRAINCLKDEPKDIALGGTIYDGNHSSLDIETKALNEAITYLDNLKNSHDKQMLKPSQTTIATITTAQQQQQPQTTSQQSQQSQPTNTGTRGSNTITAIPLPSPIPKQVAHYQDNFRKQEEALS